MVVGGEGIDIGDSDIAESEGANGEPIVFPAELILLSFTLDLPRSDWTEFCLAIPPFPLLEAAEAG